MIQKLVAKAELPSGGSVVLLQSAGYWFRQGKRQLGRSSHK